MLERQGSHGAGTWSVPGGWMEYGESFQQTAEREVMEEVGIKINNVRFGAVTNTVFSIENVHSITVWLLSNYEDGELKIGEPDKISNLAWYDFNTLPKPLFQPWNQLLNSEFIAGIKKSYNSAYASDAAAESQPGF